MSKYKTGFFGRAGSKKGKAGATKVHIVAVEDNRPVCRYVPHPTYQFQFCSAGIHAPYVECKQCCEWMEKREEA